MGGNCYAITYGLQSRVDSGAGKIASAAGAGNITFNLSTGNSEAGIATCLFDP